MTALQARFKSVVWKSVPGSRRTDLFLRIIRVVILTVRGFNNDLCVVRASTLTFYTLLSIVPLFATVFGIAKGFGLHQLLERQLSSRIDWLRELIAVLLKFSSAAIENARGGIIAGIGVLVFFVTVVGLLGAVEEAFNTIWEVRKPRSLGRKFADYLSVVLIGTVLLSVSGGINVFIAAQVRLVADRVAFLAPAGQAMLLLLGLVPYVANWLLFAFLFLFIPNTPVPLYAGIVAGAFTAGIFLLVQWIYITFQVGVSNYNAIYGSFAALPLFLVWMQLSWTITLLGGELSWAVVNSRTYGFFPDFPSISPYLRKVIASAIVMEIKQAFVAGKQPLTAGQICQALRIPRQFFYPLAGKLMEAGLINEVVNRGGGFPCYQSAVPPDKLVPAAAMAALEYSGTTALPDESPESLAGSAATVAGIEAVPATRREKA